MYRHYIPLHKPMTDYTLNTHIDIQITCVCVCACVYTCVRRSWHEQSILAFSVLSSFLCNATATCMWCKAGVLTELRAATEHPLPSSAVNMLA